jgi:hypothetical protein
MIHKSFSNFAMSIILLPFAIAILCSCKKIKINLDSYYECSRNISGDSTAISQKLIGSWRWISKSCFWEGRLKPANKKMIVTFNNNQTFLISENGNTIAQGSWKLVVADGSFWGIESSASGDYIIGRILFCKDELLFSDSYRDGCDKLFRKVD